MTSLLPLQIVKNFSVLGFYQKFANINNQTDEERGYKIGFLHRCQHFPYQTSQDIDNIITQSERFVILLQQTPQYVHDFSTQILPKLTKPYVIISCMDDGIFPLEIANSVQTEYNAISNKPLNYTSTSLLRHWFSINKEPPNTKYVTSIPYGLDYWTLTTRKLWANTPISTALQQDELLTKLQKSATHFSKRIPMIYTNYQFNIYGNGYIERTAALQMIPSELTECETHQINRYDTWGKYTQFAFVASPRGNGYDAIRTWEALMLGCIVIARRFHQCGMNILYDGLPVLVVEHWSDVTRELLDKTLADFSTRTFDYEKLTMKYWTDKVYAAFNDA
jgi:hypothetical protein